MKKMRNTTHIEGLIYQHKLEVKTTGPNSKNPGTEYLRGSVDIATDDSLVNIVSVYFNYEPEIGGNGKPNLRYPDLKKIIDGTYKTVMTDGAENATKLRIDSALALNEWFNRDDDRLISVKRNEGGFIHVAPTLTPDEKLRNTFDVDMIISGARMVEGDPENNTQDKVVISGCIFNFKNEVLPVEFSVVNQNAMNYFENLGATKTNPVFTHIKGRQVSEVITRKIVEESAFGEDYVREVTNNRKDFVVTWAQAEPYIFDSEETITAKELSDALAARETYLADLKARNDEYKASATTTAPAQATTGGFNF